MDKKYYDNCNLRIAVLYRQVGWPRHTNFKYKKHQIALTILSKLLFETRNDSFWQSGKIEYICSRDVKFAGVKMEQNTGI